MECKTENCSNTNIKAKGLCHKCYRRKHYLDNKERNNTNSKRYYNLNKDRILSIGRKRHEDNKEVINAKKREYDKANKERLKLEKPLYSTWLGIRRRCNNPNTKDYKNYGGRGIKVCERWDSYEKFEYDMGLKPSPNHSIDRIDVNGNYSPDNCKWSTPKQQANNKRGCNN